MAQRDGPHRRRSQRETSSFTAGCAHASVPFTPAFESLTGNVVHRVCVKALRPRRRSWSPMHAAHCRISSKRNGHVSSSIATISFCFERAGFRLTYPRAARGRAREACVRVTGHGGVTLQFRTRRFRRVSIGVSVPDAARARPHRRGTRRGSSRRFASPIVRAQVTSARSRRRAFSRSTRGRGGVHHLHWSLTAPVGTPARLSTPQTP
jgi:hypothetical protein